MESIDRLPMVRPFSGLFLSLFNLEGTFRIFNLQSTVWGYSSAGRAPALQAGGQRFDSAHLHQAKGRAKTPTAKTKMGS